MFAIAVLMAVLVGCTGKSGNAPTSGAQSQGAATKTIGVSIQDLQAQFYEAMQQGMKDEATKYGYAITFTDANRDQAKQVSQVEDFLSKRVDAIILTPVDSTAVGPAIVEANTANVPVFTADIASTSSKGVVISHVASDNVQGGRVAADLLCNGARRTGNGGDHRSTGSDVGARSRQGISRRTRRQMSERQDRSRPNSGRRPRAGFNRHG